MKKSSIALLLLSLSPLASFAATAPLDLVGPVSDYKIYVTEEIGELVTQTQAFTDAINKGDLATAKKLYAPTRVHYESIEPIAELFSDLDASIDSRVDDHEKGVTAEDFTGFHRIEYALFSQNSTQGLQALTAKLNADVNDLKTRVDGLTFPPEKVVGGAAALLEEVAATKISGEEDRYSHTDLYDFQGNIDGAKKSSTCSVARSGSKTKPSWPRSTKTLPASTRSWPSTKPRMAASRPMTRSRTTTARPWSARSIPWPKTSQPCAASWV